MPPIVTVLDSWAIVAFLEEEPAAERVEEIIISSLDSNKHLLISVINMGEVWYSIARAHSSREADNAVRKVISAGLEMVAADWEMTLQAARIKARYKLAYADCFAAALALSRDAELVTGDPEFRQLKNELNIVWLN
ncbi:MAG TPA: type II toxin-antitoxin system VapC family toxin [Anaerolineales bacterium]